MKEQLITFETAKLAKEKVFFDLSVDGDVRISQQNLFGPDGHPFTLKGALGNYYDDVNLRDCYNRPTQSLLQKWLRDVHNIHIDIRKEWENGIDLGFEYLIEEEDGSTQGLTYKTYEEALEIGLQEALKLVNHG